MESLFRAEKDLEVKKLELTVSVHLLLSVTFHPIFCILFGVFSFSSAYYSQSDLDTSLVLVCKINCLINGVCALLCILFKNLVKKENYDFPTYKNYVGFFTNLIKLLIVAVFLWMSTCYGDNYTDSPLDRLCLAYSIIVLIFLVIVVLFALFELYNSYQSLQSLREVNKYHELKEKEKNQII